jgi:PIN domain nuclease of toxin-antitoxin system
MRVLLDTHTFIWWDEDHTQLSTKALAVCQDEGNTLLLSLVSVWEMQIKIQLGKLETTLSLEEKIKHQHETNDLEILPITLRHIFTLDKLPEHHRDPFDRLLIAQAIHENIPIISYDSQFAKYPIQLIW